MFWISCGPALAALPFRFVFREYAPNMKIAVFRAVCVVRPCRSHIDTSSNQHRSASGSSTRSLKPLLQGIIQPPFRLDIVRPVKNLPFLEQENNLPGIMLAAHHRSIRCTDMKALRVWLQGQCGGHQPERVVCRCYGRRSR